MFEVQQAYHVSLPPPLAGAANRHFVSTERDEVRSYVGRMYCEHSLDLVNARGKLDTRIAEMRCGGVSLTEMSYGADVMIDAGRLENFYLIQIPVAGKSGLTLGGVQGEYKPGRGSVQDPLIPLEMFWSGDCRKIVLRFERAIFERFAEAHIGRPLAGPLQLASWFDLTSPLGEMLVQQVRSMIGILPQASGSSPDGAYPLLERHFENTAMAALLFLQPHNLTAELTRGVSASDPVPVRRVREFLQAHAHEPIDMTRLAEVAGIPLRTLHHQFRQALGLSPMQLLRDIRLDLVRKELQVPNDLTSVTDVAMNWGFEHLGRFALAYRKRFGETPRETLRRHR